MLALVGMLLYIAARYEWTYGAAEVITVFHDVIVTIGFFSIFNGRSPDGHRRAPDARRFSVNDTIVPLTASGKT